LRRSYWPPGCLLAKASVGQWPRELSTFGTRSDATGFGARLAGRLWRTKKSKSIAQNPVRNGSRRILEFEQGGNERATYGEALLKQPARDPTESRGRAFSRAN